MGGPHQKITEAIECNEIDHFLQQNSGKPAYQIDALNYRESQALAHSLRPVSNTPCMYKLTMLCKNRKNYPS